MSFSYDDVQRLTRPLDGPQFDELPLDAEEIKLTLRRSGATSTVPSVAAAATTLAPSVATPMARPAAAVSLASSNATSELGLTEMRATMLSTVYSAPRPGAEPFIAIDASVSDDSAVGVIKVMKLLNSISAGVEGKLVEVLVRDGERVEFDQVLMRVRLV